MKRILFLCILSAAFHSGFTQWRWLNPLPQGNTLYTVFVVDSTTMWSAGDYGTLMKSDDGGTTWSVIPTGYKEFFMSIWFEDKDNGWVVGSGGTILSTANGGQTWIAQAYQSFRWKILKSVCFVDISTGWIAGHDSGLLKTTDGGEHWILIANDSLAWCKSVRFLDEQTGWVLSNSGDLMHTGDGGESWTFQVQTTIPKEAEFDFCDPHHGCYIRSGIFLTTNDGGANWDTAVHPEILSPSIFMKDSVTVFLSGFSSDSNFVWHGRICTSTDGGLTWSITDFDEVTYFTFLTGGSENSLIGCGTAGSVYTSHDGGESWKPGTSAITDELISSVYFDRDNLHGWCCTTDGMVIRTVNGGLSWESVKVSYEQLNVVCFLDEFRGFVGGEVDTLYKTTDGGITWEPIYFMFPGIVDMAFPDKLTGWLGIRSGGIYKSEDGGNSWIKNKQVGTVEAISFPDKDHGWSVGKSTKIYATTDGGLTWERQYCNISPSSMKLTDVSFVDSLNGWVTGSSGRICSTRDGGITWEVDDTTVRYGDWIQLVHFTDTNTGWIAVHEANWYTFLLMTKNGGLTWDTVNTISGNYLYSMFAWDSTNVYTGGAYGTIIKYVGKPNALPESNETSGGSVCYPNPTRRFVSIRLDVKTKMEVTLSIFNLRGTKVIEFRHQHISPGQNEIKVSMSNLPDGIYFYKINMGNQFDMGKIVLIK